MQSAVFRALEFDRIREALAREAATPLGRERAIVLQPAVEPSDIRRLLDLTSEAVAFLKAAGTLAIEAPESLPEILQALEIADEPLVPLQLVGLARFAESVEGVAGGLRHRASVAAGSDAASGLRQIANRVPSFERETTGVRQAILPSGEIVDTASPTLRDIREALRRQRARLRSTLETITRGRDSAKYLQDQIVTDRNGRYVIVVRAEHRDAVPGIVHGTSGSGASLFVEPLSTVELNNDVVALVEREKEEIHRILLSLTNAFRFRAEDLDALIESAADLDEVYAKARLAGRVDGLAPALATDGRVELRGARHPLLIPAVRDLLEGGAGFSRPDATGLEPAPPAVVVSSDLIVAPPTRALVISGPNTGGKTVALKALGLLAIMAQSGLLIPVEPGSSLTAFRSIFADIGDEQSIAASLSTFSARVSNLIAFDRHLEAPALILLDEVGSGTDPIEGGALGAAMIDHFRRRGAIVVATTHDDALKSYAATTDEVAAAAFGFNPETFAPTYRLVYGAPGRSLALEIAERLGMPASVIADARARRTGRESQLAAHLARVDQELAAVEQEKRQTVEEREALARERRELQEREARLTEREAVLKKRLDDKLNERLREARAEVDAVVARLKTKASALAEEARQAQQGAQARGPVLTTGQVGGLRAEARAALGAIGDALSGTGSAASADDVFTTPPALGQKVFITSFGAEGLVRAVSGTRIDVEVRGKRMRVSLEGLRRTAQGSGREDSGGASRPQASTPHVSKPQAFKPSTELVLIGDTVDEAIARAEKFLDDALLGDEKRVRIVHGHGTGKLRDALRAFFGQHPLVASATPAPDNEGGQGATIVELKD